MSTELITVTPAFKKQAQSAITAIILFAITYILLLVFAVGLTILCVYGALEFVINYPRFITLALGLGLAGLGVLVLIFLIKFVFKSHKVDRSHLYEIQEKDQPELFAMISDIVKEVGTQFPKKVYLSADVNASVFYDSSFWSMLFPVRKNLQIGLGLVNSVTKSELKAILSHEFGHFSQRTMKVGSYVYNVNQVIFNMLYENNSYSKIVQGWANITGYFSIFAILAMKIVEAIQWTLKKLYAVVNKKYMGLSREMEFHADEIAASVTGYLPLKTSLLRLSLADHSLNTVLGFYDKLIEKNLTSTNIYTEQRFVMQFLAGETGIALKHNFPDVTLEDINRYNQSKLIIKDQWASHPSTEDRINRLQTLNPGEKLIDNAPANTLFTNIELLQQALQDKIFSQVTYSGDVAGNSLAAFTTTFTEDYKANSFPPFYNGYYDNRSPEEFDTGIAPEEEDTIPLEALFSAEKINLVYASIALENDINILTQVAANETDITTFDYDGKKYKKNDATILKAQLLEESALINTRLKENDIAVFNYFNARELKGEGEKKLASLYIDFFNYRKSFETQVLVCSELQQALQFVQYSLPTEQIVQNFSALESKENELKKIINGLLSLTIIEQEITEKIRKDFNQYLSGKLEYFGVGTYYDENLKTLFTVIDASYHLLGRAYFLYKKHILTYQETLLKNSTQVVLA